MCIGRLRDVVRAIVDSAADMLEGCRRLRERAARPELIVPGPIAR